MLESTATWTEGTNCGPEPTAEWTIDHAGHALRGADRVFAIPPGWLVVLETPRVAVLQAPAVDHQVRDSIELAFARVCKVTEMPLVSNRMARRALRESIPGTIKIPNSLNAALGAPWISVQEEGTINDVPLWLITTTIASDDKGTYVMAAAAGCAATSKKFSGRCYAAYMAMLESGVGNTSN